MHTPAPVRADRTLAAILLSLLALTLFALMALIVKHLSPRYDPEELSAYRNLFALIPALVALYATPAWHAAGRPWIIRQWKLGLFRGSFIIFAQYMFYTALALIPFATATTISNANALFMTALAVPLLKERVGPVRWGAVLIGFVGVILVTRPGSDSFQWAALLPVGAAFLYALNGVTARLMDPDVPSPLLNIYASGTSAVGGVIFALALGGFTPIASWTDLGWIVLMGTLGGLAVLCVVVSFRMAEQADLAPFTYFAIPISFALGWIFYREAPVEDLFPGALLIIAGGLLIVWRERQKSRRPVVPEPPET